MTYLLSCSDCERTIPLETKDAGRFVSCECGAVLDVGTMRDIRQLPVAGQDSGLATASPGRRRWSPVQGGVFALGVMMMCGAGGYIASQYIAISSLDLGDQAAQDKSLGDQTIDALTPFGAYEAWKMLQQMGIGDQEKPKYMLDQQAAALHRSNARIGMCVVGLGLIVMLIGVLALKPAR